MIILKILQSNSFLTELPIEFKINATFACLENFPGHNLEKQIWI